MFPKTEKITDEAYLDKIRRCRCISCGAPPPGVEAAHLRMADPDYGKPESGMGRRPGDQYVLPLCARCHLLDQNAQHNTSERTWWARDPRNVTNPVGLALALYALRDDLEAMRALVARVIMQGYPADDGDVSADP